MAGLPLPVLLGGDQQSLAVQLSQCQLTLAAALRDRIDGGGGGGAATGNQDAELSPEMRVLFVFTSVFLVLFAGLMAGLTLGLLSLDKVDLEVIKRSGSPREVWLVERVEPVLARPHFLLATLLLCNSVAMEALPLFLDRLLNPVAAIILSVTAILIFGEVVPQAVCKRFGLQVGAYMAWFVRFLMLLTAFITWPIGKLLDWVLGEESALFKRRELKALMSMHAEPAEDGEESTLTLDELQVIQGALDMASKTAEAAMTPIDKVFLLSSEAEINDDLLQRILQRGHSRLPVYEGEDRYDIVGLVLVKELLMVDEDAGVKISDLCLRDVPFMSADTMLYDVLKVFRYGRSHMSVLTRPGDSGRLEVIGIITIEDVLEELLQQEIVDETDQYVDNLQSVRTSTLPSLQQLPPNLRRLLTRSIIMAAPAAPPGASGGATSAASAAAAAGGASEGGRSLHTAASMGAASVAGAVVAAASLGSPRAVAAAAATSVLAASRRLAGGAAPGASAGGGGGSPSKKPQLPAAPIFGGGGAAAAAPADGSRLAGGTGGRPAGGLLAQDKPPVPRRTAALKQSMTRQASPDLWQPLLGPDVERQQQEADEQQQQERLEHQRLMLLRPPPPLEQRLVQQTLLQAEQQQQRDQQQQQQQQGQPPEQQQSPPEGSDLV